MVNNDIKIERIKIFVELRQHVGRSAFGAAPEPYSLWF